METVDNPLRHITHNLVRLRRDEAECKSRRVAAEDELLAMFPAKDSGTVKADLLGLRLSIRYSLNYSVDQFEFERIADRVPVEIGKRILRWKPEVNVAEIKYLALNEPEIYEALATAITAKPARPTITAEIVEEA